MAGALYKKSCDADTKCSFAEFESSSGFHNLTLLNTVLFSRVPLVSIDGNEVNHGSSIVD